MVTRLLIASGLMALCVVIHAGGVTWALRRLRRTAPPQRFWPGTWLFILVAGWIVLLHLFEISVWAGYYVWKGAIEDLQSALYFSAVTYTTTGYGDVVPVTPLGRMVGALVMISGLGVFGLWTGILATGFAAETRRDNFLKTWETVSKVPFFATLGPAAIERLRHFGERHVRKPHWHAQFAAKLGGKPHVLVSKLQGKARRVVFIWQKPVIEAVEGPLPPAGAGAHGFP